MKSVEFSFVKMLHALTETGLAQWARSKHDKGFVYCFAGEDLIIFEVRGGDGGKPTDPNGEVDGLVAKCRNTSYLWLEGSPGFETLLGLLRKAPEDEEKFIRFRRQARDIPNKILQSLLTH
jgi:hypothetical protein